MARMEDLPPRQVSGLHRLGHFREDPGHGPRQLQRIRPQQDPGGAPARQGPAPRHRLLRGVRAQDGRAVQERRPIISAITSANSTACPSARTCPPIPSTTSSVRAFFEALSPAELDLYDKAVAAIRHEAESGRTRSGSRSSGSATRPAWPSGSTTRPTRTTAWWPPSWSGVGKRRCGNSRRPRAAPINAASKPEAPERLSPRNEEAFLQVGRDIPELWGQGRFAPQQKKAFLRCLIDKVVIHRTAPDTSRCGSSGGVATRRPQRLPVTVGSLARLSSAEAMERDDLELAQQGKTDEEIAAL